jgi:hypothetical protein
MVSAKVVLPDFVLPTRTMFLMSFVAKCFIVVALA